jgi:hypothetical protein
VSWFWPDVKEPCSFCAHVRSLVAASSSTMQFAQLVLASLVLNVLPAFQWLAAHGRHESSDEALVPLLYWPSGHVVNACGAVKGAMQNDPEGYALHDPSVKRSM